jgi:outer membrane protein assembly factor BamB
MANLWAWLTEQPARRLGPVAVGLLALAVLAATTLPEGSQGHRVAVAPTTSTTVQATSTEPTTTTVPSTTQSTTTAPPAATTRPATTAPPATTTATTRPQPPAASWPQFGQGSARTGASAAGPNPSGAHLRWRAGLDGPVYAEPLVTGGLVVAATENDTVYGLRPADGGVAWQQHLGGPIAGSSLPCGDIDPSGITGTPAVDPATSTLYVVAFVQPSRHDLIALDLASGRVRWRRAIDPPGLSADVEQQRGALTVANGRVYVPFGGLYGDCGNYKGAVVASALDGSGPVQAWIAPAAREAGIWAPGGAAVDGSGNLFVATGNGSSVDPAAYDGGNSVFRLTPDLRAGDSFAPANWAALSASDTDLGSIGPVLVSNNDVFIAGKDGTGYLLNSRHLGGIGGQLFAAPACAGGGAFGGAAWAAPMVVLDCNTGPIGVQVDGPAHFRVAWSAAGGIGGAPSVAAGVAWVVERSGHLVALDLASGAVRANLALGGQAQGFPSAALTPDMVIAPAGAAVAAFGD